MLGVIALPLGAGAGWWVSAMLIDIATGQGLTTVVSLVLLVVLLAAIWLLFRRGQDVTSVEGGNPTTRVLILGQIALVALLVVFSLGLVSNLSGVLGIRASATLGLLDFFGSFLTVMSDSIEILLPFTVAVLVGLIAASLGTRYGSELIIRMEGIPAKITNAVITGVGAAVAIYGIGWSLNWLYQFDYPERWTTIPALAGAAIFGLGSLLLSPKRAFPIGSVIYGSMRTIFNLLRSIEPLIMGVVFVIWVGIGPFAGLMALTLHTIAALGKLFSEQIEGISEEPVEAITATGANRLQTIAYAVVPQIIPPYIAYTLYRWDINVRMSTIIGFVGAGGIGLLLSQSIRLLRYREASVMMLAIAIVVSALDYLSSRMRARFV
jgi:phosphonate ABC transporter permease subunit PhnE